MNAFTFPHPTLTVISAEPNNTSLRRLTQEIYANAMSVHSTRGGGANGHLALVMPPNEYLARTNQAFIAPVHPGDQPTLPPNPTSHQITEVNRRFAADLAEHTRYLTIQETLRQQILAAVNQRYLRILANPIFGFADVSCHAMLAHLRTTYGNITNEEYEKNRNKLYSPWNPDEPIEELWLRIVEIREFASQGGINEVIADATVIRTTLEVLENTGVFALDCVDWRKVATPASTYDAFHEHFTKANKERLRRADTAQTSGFHGAHAATTTTGVPVPPAPATNYSITTDGCKLYYCWTHGLGKRSTHTSRTCKRKADGHQDEATATNMMGGSNIIMQAGHHGATRTNAGN
jgi:hypothetical protein